MQDITFSNLAKKTDFPQLKLDPENYEHTNDLRPDEKKPAVVTEEVKAEEAVEIKEVKKEVKEVKKIEEVKEEGE